MSRHYYNEHNAYRAAVLRERMGEGLLPEGIVDERDIETIPDKDFAGYTQIHLFAGIGGFPLGLRRSGFPEDVRIVTGGFPCQDISNAGKRAGITGSRSGLWREMVRCIRVVRPRLVFVENVAALLCRGMGEVLGDLAAIGYDAQGDCISAADVGAPHLRRRIWIVAYPIGSRIRLESIAQRWSIRTSILEHDGEVADSGSSGRNAGEFDAHARQSDSSRCCALADDPQQRIGQLPVFERESRQADADFDGRGETLADAEKRGQPVRGISSEQERCDMGQPTLSGEIVADANGARCDGRTWEQQSFRGRSSLSARSGGCGELENSTESRLQRQNFREESDARDGRQHTESCRSSRWPVEPNVGRVAHGIPRRVDRLAALGDAIVPQCVEEVVRRFFKK
jgi:DNA (cytosine-5)-methyltransferase 1